VSHIDQKINNKFAQFVEDKCKDEDMGLVKATPLVERSMINLGMNLDFSSNPDSRSVQPAGITQILTFDKNRSLYSRLYSNLQNNTRLTSINNRLKHLILKICSTGGFDTSCSWSPMIILSVSYPGQDLQNWRGVVAVLRTKKVVATTTLLATFIIALL